MEHVGIDLGKRESQVCVRAASGEILLERRTPTSSLRVLLGKRSASRVVMESSSEAFAVADIAIELGHEVRVIPATMARMFRVGARGLKTDERDARALSEASCRTELPSIHVPSSRSRERKALCTSREALVSMRTELTNTVDGYMRTQLVRVSVRAPSPRYVEKVREAFGSSLPSHVERLLVVVESIDSQLRVADAELKELAKKDETCALLMTMPGVGPVTAVRFVSAIDDPNRFDEAHQVGSYLGLTPSENTTGFKTKRGGITKAGAPRLRWTLIQGAWCLYRTQPNDPMVQWAMAIERRAGRKKAVTALARKMACVLWTMWKRNERYAPPPRVVTEHESN